MLEREGITVVEGGRLEKGAGPVDTLPLPGEGKS